MIAIVTITYEVPLSEVEQHTAAHRAHLKTLHERGNLVASGPFVPRTGGLLVMRAPSLDEVRALLANDPFQTNGIARYEIKEWAPTLGATLFERS